MKKLCALECVPCHGPVAPLGQAELADLVRQLDARWCLVEEHRLTRTFVFPDFASALAFVNRVGALAEQQGHHPDILLRWGLVQVDLYTHKAGGLTRNDFILAARIDVLASEPSGSV